VLYSFAAHGATQVGDQRTTITVTGTERGSGTVYAPDGQPTGQTVSKRGLMHFTFIDSGDAGVPFDSDPSDDFIVDIEPDQWTCS
jgi:hypothetical protein